MVHMGGWSISLLDAFDGGVVDLSGSLVMAIRPCVCIKQVDLQFARL
jgi:hypothetical protein